VIAHVQLFRDDGTVLLDWHVAGIETGWPRFYEFHPQVGGPREHGMIVHALEVKAMVTSDNEEEKRR